MHRTTVSFGDEDWKRIRKIATENRMTVSRLIALAVARFKEERKEKPATWRFDWKPRPMGAANANFRTREGIYEFSNRL